MHKKSNISLLSFVFAVVIVLVVALVLVHSLRRTTYVTLPSDTPDTEQDTQLGDGDNSLNTISVTTDTVQTIVASLNRSDHRRTIRIEQFWSGGSGTRDVTVTIWGDYQRLDETVLEGRVEHSIATQDTLYMWMDEDSQMYTSPLGDFTLDQMQGIPTYEDVLAIDKQDIVEAYYDTHADLRCIYVETQADGYTTCYWVSVDNGLLVAAERLEGETLIYTMEVVSEEALIDVEAYFVLPDGTEL